MVLSQEEDKDATWECLGTCLACFRECSVFSVDILSYKVKNSGCQCGVATQRGSALVLTGITAVSFGTLGL